MKMIRSFLESGHRRAEMQRLRDRGELDRILRAAEDLGIDYDQAPNIHDVLGHKHAMGQDQGRVPAFLTENEKALWWVVRRYRETMGQKNEETLTSLAMSALKGRTLDPIQRMLNKRRMHAELKRLRAKGELERIIEASGYTTTGPAQGEWCHVYRKGTESDRASCLFASPGRDEALWWILQRCRENVAGPKA